MLPDLMRRLKANGTLKKLEEAGGELGAEDGLSPAAQELMKRLRDRVKQRIEGESLDQLAGK